MAGTRYTDHGTGEQFYAPYRLRRHARLPATVLMGCASARIRPTGEYDPLGSVLDYLVAGRSDMGACCLLCNNSMRWTSFLHNLVRMFLRGCARTAHALSVTCGPSRTSRSIASRRPYSLASSTQPLPPRLRLPWFKRVAHAHFMRSRGTRSSATAFPFAYGCQQKVPKLCGTMLKYMMNPCFIRTDTNIAVGSPFAGRLCT